MPQSNTEGEGYAVFSIACIFSLHLSTVFSSVLHNKNYSTGLLLTLSKTDGNVYVKDNNNGAQQETEKERLCEEGDRKT